MFRLIARRALLPALAHLLLWVDKRWPEPTDLDVPIELWPADVEDDLLDWTVRRYNGIPDDPRELTP